MNTNLKTHLIEVPIGGSGGEVWNRLHSEREDICEAMLKDCQVKSEVNGEADAASDMTTANWHQELLQARLRKIDDALDRLMSGSYGNCNKCGKWIADTKLAFDPAIEFCLSCWDGERGEMIGVSLEQTQPQDNNNPAINSPTADVALNSLRQFDTILVRTLNSDYRILLLDPNTGRALIEGGEWLTEPREGSVTGSKLHGSYKAGSIAVGHHLEMWVDGKIISTSPVQSISIERHDAAESIEATTAAVH